jgi:CRP-like cAMP-binding protein
LLKELLELPAIGNDLLQELRVVPLTVNQVLYEQGDKIEYLYFPLDSVISDLAIMEDGTTIETALVGP